MILALGAVIAIASVVLTVMYGQTRILFAMSRDGLVPDVFQRVSPGRRVPVANTVIVAVFIGILAAVIPLGLLVDATSIGTLFAFALVSVGVIVLRRTRPELPRSFRTPFFPVTPLLGVALCVYLMVGLGGVTWIVFALWCAVGLAAYFSTAAGTRGWRMDLREGGRHERHQRNAGAGRVRRRARRRRARAGRAARPDDERAADGRPRPSAAVADPRPRRGGRRMGRLPQGPGR